MAKHLDAILKALGEGTNIADALTQHLPTLTADELAEVRTAAADRFDTIRNQAELSEEDVNTLETLRDVIVGVRTEQGDRDTRAAELAERVAALGNDITDPTTEDTEDEDAGTDEDRGDPDPAPDPTTEPATEPALVASRRAPVRVRARDIPGTPPPAPGTPRARIRYTMRAAPDVGAVPAGTVLSNAGDFGRVAAARASGSGQLALAVIDRDIAPEYTVPDQASDQTFTELVNRVANEALLPGNSLLAAAGWCAPSEIDYSLCPILEGTDHMVDLPTIGINRGGLRYFNSPQFPQVYEMLAKQVLTEANLIANTAKTCIEAPCPTPTEVRLDAIPLCIQQDIIQSVGYPESVDDFARRVLIGQQRFVNANTIARMVTGSEADSTALAPARQGVSHQVLDVLELRAEWMRDLYRMRDTETLELVAPLWLRTLVRQDLGHRHAVGAQVITDAMVASHFAAIGVRVQWVRDWQTLSPGTGGPPAAFNPATAWPTSAQVLLYPAGTWIRGQRSIIRLDGIYDKANLVQNKFISLFVEDGLTVFRRCTRSLAITMTGLCVSGAMGPATDICAPPEESP